MATRKGRCLRVLIGLAILGMPYLILSEVRASSTKGVLKQGIHFGLSADWLDPATTGHPVSAHFALYLFHDALVKPMPEGPYTPCLAESWTISPDAKVYEFKLRKGVKFHNGDTLTAEDVVFSFWRYKASHAKLIHGKTERVEAIDPYLVRIHFKEPFPDFLEYLLPGVATIGWIVPKKYVEKVGEAGFKKYPVGAGPYKFVEFVPGVKFVGEAFEEYWRKVPNIKRMEFFVVIETATRLAMVKRGETDVATTLMDVFYHDAKKDPNLRVINAGSPSTWMVYMAAQWDPKSPWSDARVRKAASLAIDRQVMVDTFAEGANPTGSLGLKGDPLAVDFPADPYDPQRAKRLLAQAGYPNGFHGGIYYPYEGHMWPQAELVANYWKAIGITVDTVLLDRPAWVAYRAGGKMKNSTFFETLMAPTIGGRLSYLFGSTSYGNYPDIQALWDRYSKAVDPRVRKDLVAEIQGLIHERTMFIPLRDAVAPHALGRRVKGNPFKIDRLLWFNAPFEDVELSE